MNVASPKKDQIGLTPKLISEKGSNSVIATKFPATRDEIGELVLVAFTFTSIDGKRPINNWTQPINQLELIINSKPGSTYITKWQVAYKTVTNKNIQHKSGAFSAPQSASVYLPKDAVDVQLSIKLPGVFQVIDVKSFGKILLISGIKVKKKFRRTVYGLQMRGVQS